jgi:serine/threonine protein kinase
VVIFQPGESPGSPPELEDFKFAASLGGNPASGLTYLYERKNEKKTDGEKWVVKYVRLSDSTDLASLRQLLAAICDVPLAALPHPQAYCLVPTSQPTHLALCFPHLKGVDLARSPLLDLAAIHDVMTATLDSLAALHRHGLTHGHVCAGNIFLEAASQIALTDSGMNGIRSLIGAELTGPAPSAHHDLVAFGELCLKLLGETATAPQPSRVRPAREHPQDWPGAPLLALACRLRQDAELTASQALHLVQGVPRPKVNRLLTAPRWRSPRE